MLTLSDLLEKAGLGNEKLIAYRHTPTDAEPALLAQMTTFALHEPELIATYQALQSSGITNSLLKNSYIASFARSSGSAALFLGIFQITGRTETTYGEFAQRP